MRRIRRVLLLAVVLWGGDVLPAAAGQAAGGWISSTSPSLDFRTNGSALPMYGLFAASLVVFLIGVRRYVRELGLRGADREGAGAPRVTLRGVARLLDTAVLQRRLARRRDSAWTHLPLFWGVVVLALGSLLIMVDSYVLRWLGLQLSRGPGYRAFQLTLDVFGVVLVGGVGAALVRRLWIRPAHTQPNRPLLVVLGVLLAMGLSGFFLEGLRIRLEGTSEPWSFAGNAVAALLARIPASPGGGLLLYKVVWWAHAVTAFGLIAAVPYSPLRHTLTAPLHILLAPDRLSGKLSTPFRLAELVRTGKFDVKAGVSAAEDFSWRERLALTACAGSGACQDVCPAWATGTPLSPMRLMDGLERKRRADPSRDVRDGAAEEDAIWSCTLCGACAQACPVLVDPMHFIIELRRGLAGANRLGKRRTELLSNLSYAGNPYGLSAGMREELAADLGVPALAERPRHDMLYWLGCAATFDPRARAIAEATIAILRRAGIDCAILGPEECCCGDPARRLGEEGLFQELVAKNIAMLESRGVRKVVTHCAHCFNALRNEYPEFGARIEVQHHATLIHSLLAAGKLRPAIGAAGPVTLHDSCYVARFAGKLAQPREVLRAVPGAKLAEMQRSGDNAFCCGAGGASYWYDVPREEKMSAVRVREARDTGARVLVTECPYCLKMLEDAADSTGDATPLQVRDIAEVVADSLGPSREVE